MCFPHTRSFIQGAVSPNLEGVRECLHTCLLWQIVPPGYRRESPLGEGRAAHAALGRARASLRSARPYVGACPTTVFANTIPLGILPVSSSGSSAWYSASGAEAGARPAPTVSYQLTSRIRILSVGDSGAGRLSCWPAPLSHRPLQPRVFMPRLPETSAPFSPLLSVAVFERWVLPGRR